MKIRFTFSFAFAIVFVCLASLACGSSSNLNAATRTAVVTTLESLVDQKSSDTIVIQGKTQGNKPTEIIHPTETPAPTPKFGVGSLMINPIDGAAMVYIPEGPFIMGSDDSEAFDYEKPSHEVFLNAYWIYQTEVTNAQFSKFVEETNYISTAEGLEFVPFFAGYGLDAMTFYGSYWKQPGEEGLDFPVNDNHPVVYMSWYDADAYCTWAGGRLPTEAEWEKAARGTDERIFPWGNNSVTGAKANYCDISCAGNWKDNHEDDGYHFTSPVGNYPDGASPYGIFDMAGNVKEWVSDWFGEDYYLYSPAVNPMGPNHGESKTLRGGDYISGEVALRATSRSSMEPDLPWNTTGFRCVIDH